MENKEPLCQFKLMASRDALEVIQGKWRIPIIISLTYGKKRFGEIHRDIADISPKMLSQELKSLETNKIITRTLFDTKPLTVEYSLTPLGLSTTKLLDELLNWGIHFRNEVVGK
ncbi:MAG: helix-turn-helix transcriptional regulator [Chryseobacterium sp.]|uniref:winged helix-turn-helix transcriptional regulator n=1 Tax=Chryseobacterium carnipullorum TaxID=1124835 RepID=UPI0009342494|nr:helix-turn-helix domain-containing protein [Chryseobacterium carnipullorum]MDN5396942.1 helix-turn-helix transcriptional regulator [Chryseobacterium sp.]MDN5479363.1 helix-turn-helix transcriptional regulator [Chryseobacterium sp.]